MEMGRPNYFIRVFSRPPYKFIVLFQFHPWKKIVQSKKKKKSKNKDDIINSKEVVGTCVTGMLTSNIIIYHQILFRSRQDAGK